MPKENEYKVLVEFIYKRRFFNIPTLKHPIQLKPFVYGLSIKNIDDKATPSGIIQNFLFRSAEGGEITEGPFEQFAFGGLNPGEKTILWWPEPIATVLEGQIWVQCYLKPDIENTIFITYQCDHHSKKPVKHNNNRNQWGTAIFIKRKLEDEQNWTNRLMFFLTLLIFLDGVWGLDTIFKGSWDIFVNGLRALGNILISI